MTAALLAAALATVQPQEGASARAASTSPEIGFMLAHPGREPSMSPEMASVVATCGIERSQVSFLRGPEVVGFAIHLTAEQSASPQVTGCLETEIGRFWLRDRMWLVPPFPDAPHTDH